jgi:hypothetical protein
MTIRFAQRDGTPLRHPPASSPRPQMAAAPLQPKVSQPSRVSQAERLPLVPALSAPAPYPSRTLGDVLGVAAVAIARKVQVPEAIAGQAVLAAASLAAQAHRDVRLPYGQTRPLSLYLLTIADSGDRKSAADSEAHWPTRQWEKNARATYELELADWAIQYAAHAAQRKKIENEKSLDLAERETELRALGHEPKRPLHPILTAPDPTVEGLAKAWPDAPAALGLFSAEGGAFFGGHGMSSDHKLKTAAILSELWDGNGMRRMRAGDGVSILTGRRLAAHLLVQPEAVADFLSDPLMRGQGFPARFLIAAPASLAWERMYQDPAPADEAALRRYGARLLDLLDRPARMVEGKRNELDPESMPLSPGATKVWVAFFNHIEGQCSRNGPLASVKSIAAKAAEQAARIAGVLTVVDNPDAAEIETDTMSRAIELMDWYVGEAVRLSEAGKVSPVLTKAQRLVEWVQASGSTDFLLRDVMRLGPSATRSKTEAELAIRTLIEHGWIVERATRPKSFTLITEPPQ